MAANASSFSSMVIRVDDPSDPIYHNVLVYAPDYDAAEHSYKTHYRVVPQCTHCKRYANDGIAMSPHYADYLLCEECADEWDTQVREAFEEHEASHAELF